MNIIFYPILGSVFWLKYLSVSKSLLVPNTFLKTTFLERSDTLKLWFVF